MFATPKPFEFSMSESIVIAGRDRPMPCMPVVPGYRTIGYNRLGSPLYEIVNSQFFVQVVKVGVKEKIELHIGKRRHA